MNADNELDGLFDGYDMEADAAREIKRMKNDEEVCPNCDGVGWTVVNQDYYNPAGEQEWCSCQSASNLLEQIEKEYDLLIANQKREHRKSMQQGGLFMVALVAVIGISIWAGFHFDLWGVTP